MIQKDINVQDKNKANKSKKWTKQKILEYFLANPTVKLRAREIERAVKVSFPSVPRYVKESESEGILHKETIGRVVFFTASRGSLEYKKKKLCFNLKQLLSCGVLEAFRVEMSNPVVVLFGSYSRGEDIETSDIDLYVETKSKKEIYFKRFEKKLGKEIQMHKFASLKDVPNKELANNIINGIVLNGFLEVF